jgi:protein disulfide-isomerase
MKKLLTTLATLAATACFAMAGAGWGDDYDKAVAQAKTEKKLVLLDFTGSDWCSWCKKLDAEVFSKKEFKDFAKDNLVLVEVDFPNGKKLSGKTKKQNDELKTKFGVKGFPTLVVLDGEGKEVHRIGGYKADALDDLKKIADANKPK